MSSGGDSGSMGGGGGGDEESGIDPMAFVTQAQQGAAAQAQANAAKRSALDDAMSSPIGGGDEIGNTMTADTTVPEPLTLEDTSGDTYA